ncbi:ECF transporter S component [Peptoniphilus equinus]|uniref:ECF transporter S component n=1 Tax=Peptoniphilus equinus TaxID=3016343 RepID=A0ABY7QTE8_9FIRM|nr:ECF transporter S component [Peptoniphilus equinus]WBW50007.1 ECF transporter S component [Peptoniphilus equinus]
MNQTRTTNVKSRRLVITAVLGAITVALGFTPLGFIPLGILNATTLHIPVIIGAIVEGPVVGALVGLIFGLSSLLRSIMTPTPLTPFIMNPLVSVVPRVLIGLFAGYAFIAVKKLSPKVMKNLNMVAWAVCSAVLAWILYRNFQAPQLNVVTTVISAVFLGLCLAMLYYSSAKMNGDFPIVASAFIGSMTNTVFFLGMMYLLYAEQYMVAIGQPVAMARSVILGVAVSSGLPEAILSVIVTTAVVKAVTLSKRH